MSEYQQEQFQAGRLVVALGCAQRVRVLVAVVTGPAQELCKRHNLGPGASQIAASGLVAAALLAAHTKDQERQTVQFHGFDEHQKSTFRLVAEISGNGHIRGQMEPADLPPQKELDALVTVQKFVDSREIYRGHAAVRHESIEAAIQRYFVTSQQVNGIVRIEATMGADQRIKQAAGILIEALPGMPEDEFTALFGGISASNKKPGAHDGFSELMTSFAFGQLAGEPVEVLGWQDLPFQCTCSRERVVGMLRALGAVELQSLLEEQGKAEVTCHFCAEVRTVEAPELVTMIQALNNRES